EIRLLGYQPRGPRHRYGAVLFIEKEGFLPLLRQERLAERYDLALMSTKGVSTTAARQLVEAVCADDGVPFLILRDFDKAGFTIAGTFSRATKRYKFSRKIRLFDLGLRLTDVQAWGLQDEEVVYQKKSDPRKNLKLNGATEEEVAFLCSGKEGDNFRGRRVELNAFTSDQFLSWIEGKLNELGIVKLLPDKETLDLAYRRTLEQQLLSRVMERGRERVSAAVAGLDLSGAGLRLTEGLQSRFQELSDVDWACALGDLAQDD